MKHWVLSKPRPAKVMEITLAGAADDDQPIRSSVAGKSLSGFPREQIKEVLGCNGRGRGILACDETAINDRKRLPISNLLNSVEDLLAIPVLGGGPGPQESPGL